MKILERIFGKESSKRDYSEEVKNLKKKVKGEG